MTTPSPAVYAAIAAVMADLSKEGIGKDRKNQQQGYSFRGIDDVFNELSPILSRHKLCVLPRVLSRVAVERQTRNGGALFNVAVDVEFDLVSAEDGSKHTIRTFGEAMDSADKATNKAMSAAYKYAAMQAFCIPTEGDNDADAQSHDVAPSKPARAAPAPSIDSNPFPGLTPEESAEKRVELIELIDQCASRDDLDRWKADHTADTKMLLPKDRDAVFAAGKRKADRFQPVNVLAGG